MSEPLITIDPEIVSGTPVFYGTRVPVQNLVDYLSTGETIETFLDHFPSVKREQVLRYIEMGAVYILEHAHEDSA